MKLKIKVGPVLVKDGLKELKIEELHINADISIEEIPVLAKEIVNITKYTREIFRKEKDGENL